MNNKSVRDLVNLEGLKSLCSGDAGYFPCIDRQEDCFLCGWSVKHSEAFQYKDRIICQKCYAELKKDALK